GRFLELLQHEFVRRCERRERPGGRADVADLDRLGLGDGGREHAGSGDGRPRGGRAHDERTTRNGWMAQFAWHTFLLGAGKPSGGRHPHPCSTMAGFLPWRFGGLLLLCDRSKPEFDVTRLTVGHANHIVVRPAAERQRESWAFAGRHAIVSLWNATKRVDRSGSRPAIASV